MTGPLATVAGGVMMVTGGMPAAQVRPVSDADRSDSLS